MDLSAVILLAAIAGYGDPQGGFPSAAERSLVLWTNAARVAPTEFREDFSKGDCTLADFSGTEKTAKSPLYIDVDLTEAARAHSTDMNDNGCFQHESCDGTDTWTRVGRYYDDANSGLGENIAYGSTDARYTVMSMWMCSDAGHRANIMSADFNEMGGGVDHDYMTQDFAAGELKEGDPSVRVAAEYDGSVWADWGDDAEPAELALNVGDSSIDLTLAHGSPENGVYNGVLDAEKCSAWWVSWESASGQAGDFPATGAFLSGSCDEEYDGEARGGAGNPDDDEEGSEFPRLLCSSTGEGSLIAAMFGGLAILSRRRR